MDEVAKKKYAELQLIDGKMRQIEAQIDAVSDRLGQISEVQNYLDDLKNVKLGSDALVPLSEGIFVKASIKDNENLLVNVGSGICVGKSVDGTKELLNDRISELSGHRARLVAEIEAQAMQAEKLEAELLKMPK
jgi:prefoldin alpha subunit